MSRKPENQFVSGVHKYLPPIGELYRAKMNNPYTAGIFDWWYSQKGGDIWIEYKYLPELPKRDTTLIIPDLSDLQREWGNKRYSEKRNIYVIVGSPLGGYIFQQGMWNYGCTTNEFKAGLLDRKALADWIKTQVLP